MKKKNCGINATVVAIADRVLKTKNTSVTDLIKRNQKLEAHLQAIILIMEEPQGPQKDLNQLLNKWFERSKSLLNEH